MKSIRVLALCAALVCAGAVSGAEPVDINTASAEMLAATISGVGLKRAQAIVDYRAQNGPFESVDQLAEISGIGPRIVEQSRDKLTVEKASQ